MRRLCLLWLDGRARFFTENGRTVLLEDCTGLDAESVGRVARQLGIRAGSVTVVYEGEAISHHETEAPPMPVRHLPSYIRRRMEADGVAHDSLLAFARAPDGRKVLVDAMSRSFAEELRAAFSANQLSVDILCGIAPALRQAAREVVADGPLLLQYANVDGGVDYMLYLDR
ncbi:MAG: hypothetical protein R8K47_05940, partial [Mariprofundaceae bacterium]